MISLGGATEAAIWSNMYELTAGSSLDPSWADPVRAAFAHQSMLILDDNLEHCEPWVVGVIHIGGAASR